MSAIVFYYINLSVCSLNLLSKRFKKTYFAWIFQKVPPSTLSGFSPTSLFNLTAGTAEYLIY